MAKIIRIQFRRSRLPRRLVNDGWWLVAPTPRRSVIAFPKRLARALKSRPAASSSSSRETKAMSIATTAQRAWSFRTWRLQRYLANNPVIPLDPADGGQG
jgi:hypothetical protein